MNTNNIITSLSLSPFAYNSKSLTVTKRTSRTSFLGATPHDGHSARFATTAEKLTGDQQPPFVCVCTKKIASRTARSSLTIYWAGCGGWRRGCCWCVGGRRRACVTLLCYAAMCCWRSCGAGGSSDGWECLQDLMCCLLGC